MAEPLISVIIPVYMAEQYLPCCLDSVLSQTYRHLQVILVDDGSTDSSPSICDAYQNKDARVRVIHQRNSGASAARNAALEIATGQYVAFVDSDDWLHPQMYEQLLALSAKHHAEISMCNYTFCFQETGEQRKNELPTKISGDGAVSATDAYRLMLLPNSYEGYGCNKLYIGKLFCGEAALRFDSTISVCEDLLLNMQALSRVKTVAYTPEAYYYYRIHSQSATHSNLGSVMQTLMARRYAIDMIPSDKASASKAMYLNVLLRSAVSALRENRTELYADLREEYVRVGKEYRHEFSQNRDFYPRSARMLAVVSGFNFNFGCRLWSRLKR